MYVDIDLSERTLSRMLIESHQRKTAANRQQSHQSLMSSKHAVQLELEEGEERKGAAVGFDLEEHKRMPAVSFFIYWFLLMRLTEFCD